MKPGFALSGPYWTLIASGLVSAQVLAAESGTQSGDSAGDFHYSLSAGATHSDNIAHTDTNRLSETSADAGLTAGVNYEHLRTAAVLDADLRYRTHDTGYGNELSGGLTATLRYKLMENLSWMASDNLGQSLINARNTATPDNTQTVNSFSTGPDLQLPLGSRSAINAQGRWSNVSYGKSDFDSRRLMGVLGVQRQIGAHNSLSLNGSTDHVAYRNMTSSRDFSTHAAYLGWNATGARTTLTITAGYSSIDQKLGESTGGGSYGLTVTRRTTSTTSLTLNAGRSFGDASDALGRDQSISGVSSEGRPASILTGPLKSDYATVRWSLTGSRSSLGLTANMRRDKSPRDADLDRDSIGGSLSLTRRVSNRISLDFSTSYTREDFDTASFRSNDWSTGVGLSWSLTPALGARATWTHFVGSGDTSLGPGTRDYTENMIAVRLDWSPRR